MTAIQEAGDLVAAAATGSTAGGRREPWIGRPAAASCVLLAFDCDANGAGDMAATWWLGMLPNAVRWRPLLHDVNAMHAWGQRAYMGSRRYRICTSNPSTPAAEREKETLVTTSPSLNGKSHAGSLLDGTGQRTPKTEAERAAELNTRRLPNLRANAQMVAKDLPDLPPPATCCCSSTSAASTTSPMSSSSTFGRPLLSFPDLSLQAIEKLAQRSGMGNTEAGELPIACGRKRQSGRQSGEVTEAPSTGRHPWLTPTS
ncbi:MAG: hypothetical protein U0X20_00660 [Caldilineaceae bacterium]